MYQLKVTTSAKYKDSKSVSFTASAVVEGKRKQVTITSKDKKYLDNKEALRLKTVNKLLAKIWNLDNKDNVSISSDKFDVKSDLRRFRYYANNPNWSVKFHNVSLNAPEYEKVTREEIKQHDNFVNKYLTWY
jgi:hypothetical protein